MLQILIISLCLYYVGAGSIVSSTECEPVPPNLTSSKTGQKAWDKCVEYHETLIYPCEGQKRKNQCPHPADQLIPGGGSAEKNEFPHMALIGYGERPKVKWLCGGSVISDRFILTAGHCSSSREFGQASYVTVGALTRTVSDDSKLYKIKAIHRHPDYKPPIRYNNIALIETEEKIILNQFLIPACLHIGDDIEDDRALSTSWQSWGHYDEGILQKTPTKKYSESDCSEKYPINRQLRQGINFTTQMCYGPVENFKDGCKGDTGGPLQVKSRKLECMYVVIGVASFGRACGVDEPDVFTRVAPYIPWIENIVWP